MQPTIVHSIEKILIGCSSKMNFIDNKTGELWQSFMPRLKEIKNKISADLFAVQLYNDDYNFNQFNPSAYFTKWAATEVSCIDDIPANMETLLIPQGLYAVFSQSQQCRQQYFSIYFSNMAANFAGIFFKR